MNTVASAFNEVSRVQIPGSFNTMIVGYEGFELGEVPPALAERSAYVQANLKTVSYDASRESFTDDKMSRIEILTEQMYMELMQGFKLH